MAALFCCGLFCFILTIAESYYDYNYEEIGPLFGTNDIGIGIKPGQLSHGPNIKGIESKTKWLTKVIAFAHWEQKSYHWDGRQSSIGKGRAPSQKQWKKAYSSASNIKIKAKRHKKGKKTNGIGTEALRCAKIYTDDGDVARMVRRLFYNFDYWQSKMHRNVYIAYEYFAAELYSSTHGTGIKSILSDIYSKEEKDWRKIGGKNGAIDKFIAVPGKLQPYINQIHRGYWLKQKIQSLISGYRPILPELQNHIVVYHGMSNVGMMNALDDWNKENDDVWYGPTSTSLSFWQAVNFAQKAGKHGVVFEIKVPINPFSWPKETDTGLVAAHMFSIYGHENEILFWNIPTKWMTPIKINGQWAVKEYWPYKNMEVRIRLNPGLDWYRGVSNTLFDAVDIHTMYKITKMMPYIRSKGRKLARAHTENVKRLSTGLSFPADAILVITKHVECSRPKRCRSKGYILGSPETKGWFFTSYVHVY